jgi:hypothetical protein
MRRTLRIATSSPTGLRVQVVAFWTWSGGEQPLSGFAWQVP